MSNRKKPESGWTDEQIMAWRERMLEGYNKPRARRISDDSWKKANLWDYVNDEPDATAAASRRFEKYPHGSTPIQQRIIEFLRREGRGTSPGITEDLGNNRSNVDEALRFLLSTGVIEVVDTEVVRAGGSRRRVYALTDRWGEA